jgi:hypothetical protein
MCFSPGVNQSVVTHACLCFSLPAVSLSGISSHCGDARRPAIESQAASASLSNEIAKNRQL